MGPNKLVLLISLCFIWQTSAATTTHARLHFQLAQAGTPTRDAEQSDKVKDLAQKLAEARTQDERTALLEGDRELVNEKLTVALLEHSQVYFANGARVQALAIVQLAQSIAERIGDRSGLARASTALGNAYRIQGEYDRALEELRKALPIHESLGNKRGTFYTLFFIASVNSFTGDYDLALPERLLAIGEESTNKEWIAMALSQLGAVHFTQGNYAEALDYHQKSLALYEALDNKPGVAFGLHGIGNVYRMYGNYDRALNYLEKSLALSEKINVPDLSVRTLTNLGALYRAQGNYARAEEYLQRSILLTETSALGHFSGTGFWLTLSLVNLGEINRLRGEYPKALSYFQRSASLAGDSGIKDALAYALVGTGAVLFAQGQYTSALEAAARAAKIAKQTGGRDLEWRAHLVAGKSHHALGQIPLAQQEFEEAIAIVESVRADVVDSEARSSYFATTQEPYEQYIHLLMQLHQQQPSADHSAIALQISERARARSLLESLEEARAGIRQGVDSTLLESERTLQRQLNVAAGRQTRVSRGKNIEEQVTSKQEVDALTVKLQEARTAIRLKSPRYAALTQPVPLNLKEIQQLLDRDTLLLKYAVGGERSYLWAVGLDSMKSFELPKRAEIETGVRRVIELLNNGNRWATSKENHSEYAAAAADLSNTLLPPELMFQLKAKRLVIVSDGALQYLPFGALPTPQNRASQVTSQKSKTGTVARRPTAVTGLSTLDARLPLIATYEVVSLPSASTLAVLRRETANRPRVPNSVAVLADPVFEESDERIKTAAGQARLSESRRPSLRSSDNTYDHVAGSRALLERAFRVDSHTATDSSLREPLRIGRLPFTRFEAEGILASAPPNQSLKATDFRANRETATSADLATYRYVHFATHGILNSEHPELSGIVLSMVNENGQPLDGFLRLHEVYNLNLPADLVVLSACETGLGKEIRGEGLVGLTRGFMYAGAARVVASLWKVDDAATAELMKRFYRGMLKENLRPAAALRQAKVEMWKQKRWNAPFYWAAFELQGEWK